MNEALETKLDKLLNIIKAPFFEIEESLRWYYTDHFKPASSKEAELILSQLDGAVRIRMIDGDLLYGVIDAVGPQNVTLSGAVREMQFLMFNSYPGHNFPLIEHITQPVEVRYQNIRGIRPIGRSNIPGKY
jgi:hypothetical protein